MREKKIEKIPQMQSDIAMVEVVSEYVVRGWICSHSFSLNVYVMCKHTQAFPVFYCKSFVDFFDKNYKLY